LRLSTRLPTAHVTQPTVAFLRLKTLTPSTYPVPHPRQTLPRFGPIDN
jgi:hypothetical protein